MQNSIDTMTGGFNAFDVAKVQRAYRKGKPYFIGKRNVDRREYCVVLSKYSQSWIDNLSVDSLARVAVY